jgi:hypothetical protein
MCHSPLLSLRRSHRHVVAEMTESVFLIPLSCGEHTSLNISFTVLAHAAELISRVRSRVWM